MQSDKPRILRKVSRIGPDRAQFERDIRRVVRRPDVQNAILIVRTNNRGIHFVHLQGDYMANDLALLEHAKASILHKMMKIWDGDDDDGA